MLSDADALALVGDQLLPALRAEQARLDVIDRWSRWEGDDPTVPRSATPELKSLLQLAKTPWLGLVVTTVAQTMYVSGYRSPSTDNDLPPWRLWQANDLDARQGGIHRAALTYGTAYATALPGVDATGARTAVLRGMSPRRMLAFYDDAAADDWPVYAVDADPSGTVRFYDETSIRTYRRGRSANSGQAKLELVKTELHNVGVTPVVRYVNMLDLDGRSPGEVEPHISLARRIDKTTYDRLLTQHFSSWVVRTVAGMAQPDTEEEANRKKLQLRQDDLLIAEDPDTKFGSLPATPLDGFLKAYETDIKTLAAATQTPVYALVGDLINLSADALAGARASADAKSAERKASMGKSHEQLLKLGALIVGDTESAHDPMAHVTWADTSTRSMSQAADALGKMASQLGIPARGLWGLIPGVTRTMIEEWTALAEQGGSLDDVLRELTGANATQPEVDYAAKKAAFDALGAGVRAGATPESVAADLGMPGLEFTGAVPVSLRVPADEAQRLEDKSGKGQ